MTTPSGGRAAKGTDTRSGRATGPARGRTAEAGAGASDEEMARQVASQTASDRAVEPFFERERGGAATDVEAAKARADQVK
ncbi:MULTISPECIES: hypothetical protein [unclassified Pseudofrankia]|uniref:hypothetical protein n=1 Tax=unclassified Pseudofrankia TaxID=2994372 RepID=UPI0008D8DDC4|nr:MULTISPECIES: hypothetical protein [unclassified Pseudofrankia]MDT3443689.1 hypothetical protein [Pseudofrankia sp. BMG5.37]OHV42914.1 hypothetical protein BCD48_29415 [Pseudofrankia sp. BMG5.36]